MALRVGLTTLSELVWSAELDRTVPRGGLPRRRPDRSRSHPTRV